MDPKSIVLSLHRKGWTARDMCDDLAATLGEEAIAYGTVTKDFRDARINPADETALFEVTSPHSMNQTKPCCELLKKSHSLQCHGLSALQIY
jgi:hypothetical protein